MCREAGLFLSGCGVIAGEGGVGGGGGVGEDDVKEELCIWMVAEAKGILDASTDGPLDSLAKRDIWGSRRGGGWAVGDGGDMVAGGTVADDGSGDREGGIDLEAKIVDERGEMRAKEGD